MIDTRTIFAFQALIYLVSLLVLTQAWLQNRSRYKGLGYWALLMCFTSLAYLLISLRGSISDVFSIVLGNMLLLLAVSFLLKGLKLFMGENGSCTINHLLLAVALAVVSYFTYVSPDIRMRILMVNGTYLLIFGQVMTVLQKNRAKCLNSAIVPLKTSVIAIIILNLIRVLGQLFYPSQSQNLFNQNLTDQIFVVAHTIAVTYLVMNLTLLISGRLLAEVKAEEAKFNKLFHNSPYAVAITNAKTGMVMEINHEMLELMGYEIGEVRGKDSISLGVWVDPGQRAQVIAELMAGGEIDGLELDFKGRDGKLVHTLFSASLVTINGEEHIISSMKDISEINNLKLRLQEMATHDFLTGLPNRAFFYDNFNRQLARAARNGERFAVMMFDIDGFKSINDNYGHDVGDKVLIAVAERLRGFVRASDFIARHGGDEFMLLVTGIRDGADLQKAAERLLNAFEEAFDVDGMHLSIKISVGVAAYPEDAKVYDQLIKRADEALLTAKREGKNAMKFTSQEFSSPHS